MNEQELMIGDWVQYGDIHPVKTRVLAISNIDKGKYWHIDVEPENANSVRVVPICAIKPIPLTEEILEKNGFVKQWNNNWQFNDYHSIIISEDFYIVIFELSTRLDYVHELQHALRLIGIEKEIEL